MPPILASFLTLGLILLLYRRDIRTDKHFSSALWVPLVWIFIISSRGLTEWIALSGLNLGGVSLEEGSPIDRLFYCALIGAGWYILHQRGVRLGEIMRDNRWLTAFLIYCLLAVLWSDYPFVALKRWIKVIGNPIMALVILTDPEPEKSFISVMKRCAYIILGVSVLFIKYYPSWGREYSFWTGGAMYTGITTNKNLLGVDCLIYGFFLIWYALRVRRQPKSKYRRNELILCLILLGMTWWLSQKAGSQTSLMALCVGTFMLLALGSKLLNKQLLGLYIVAAVLGILALNAFFHVYEAILGLLGRDVTLTDRTLLWADLIKEDINPFLGAGFESFWLGERLDRIWLKWTFRPNQAHNGYLETYLNLGLIGLSMLIGLLAATYAKARRALVRGYEFGRFRLAFLAAIIVYNWTEAAFKTTHIVFLMFYIIAIDIWRKPIAKTTMISRQSMGEPADPKFVPASAEAAVSVN